MNVLPASPAAATEAAESLRRGNLAILPTDTVYGITADVSNDDAVRAIYAAKHRNPDFPCQLLFGRAPAVIERYAEVTSQARVLVDALGPGGWTIIVPAREGWDSPALSGGRTVGFRLVPVEVTLDVLDALGGPVAASSANVAGRPSPITCTEAIAQVGAHCALAIDAGATTEGIDSTVIDLAGPDPLIRREGAIDRATVARILKLTHIEVLGSVRQ